MGRPPLREAPLLLVLDRQHGHKAEGSRFQPGATYDLNGDGEPDLIEALLTPLYLNAARVAAEMAGHNVLYLDKGTYRERHANAVSASRLIEPTAYLAAHLNAGGGDYGSIFYDYRSSGGKLLAECICDELRTACPELTRVRAIEAHPDRWTANAWHTIRGCFAGPGWLSGVCLEPCFIDNPAHHPLLETSGLNRMGVAIARGAFKWAALRQQA